MSPLGWLKWCVVALGLVGVAGRVAKDTGDSWRFNSTVPVEDKGRLYRFETFYTIDEYVKWAAAHPDLAPRD
jgi:hypothetical protein